MPSAAETGLVIAIAGTAVVVVVGSAIPNGVVNVSFATPKPESWTVTEWLGIGTLFLGSLTAVSGIYFKWRSDKRQASEFDARIAKLEEQAKPDADD